MDSYFSFQTMTPGKRPDNFEEHFRSKLESIYAAIANDPKFKFSDGVVQGFYWIGQSQAIQEQRHNYNLEFLITSFLGKSNRYKIWIPYYEAQKLDDYKRAADEFFKSKKFVAPNQPLTQSVFNRTVTEEFKRIVANHPEEFQKLAPEVAAQENLQPESRGLYNAIVILPSKLDTLNRSLIIKFNVRPIQDYWKTRKAYTLEPHEFQISTGIHDIEKVRNLLNDVKPELEKIGFFEYNLAKTTPKNVDKVIPKDWIDKKDIIVYRKPNQAFYSLILVRAEGRKPKILMSLGTSDVQKAEMIRAAILNEFLPSFEAGEDQDLTLRKLREFIDDRCPSEKRCTPRRFSDIRQVAINGTNKIQLYTPSLNRVQREDDTTYYGYALHIAPPPGSHVTSRSSSALVGSLNTSNENLARQRLKTLMDLAEIALTIFFTSHPEIQIPTHTTEKTARGKPILTTMFRIAKPGERAGSNEVFFEDLAEQIIKPALHDFDRYTTWQTTVTVAEDKKWQVKCEVMRNSGEAMPPDLSIFSGPFTIETSSEEAARGFAHALSLEILRKQQIFSRDRPVEQFGEASANVVIRESLRNTLHAYQNDIDVCGNNLLMQLMREKKREKE